MYSADCTCSFTFYFQAYFIVFPHSRDGLPAFSGFFFADIGRFVRLVGQAEICIYSRGAALNPSMLVDILDNDITYIT